MKVISFMLDTDSRWRHQRFDVIEEHVTREAGVPAAGRRDAGTR